MSAENLTQNYYDLLQLTPTASVQQIRRAYRELSKLYHPDTTTLPPAIATAKFQQLNEAYATLSSPERRIAYDLKLGYSRVSVIQQPVGFNRPVSERKYRSSAYLDPTDRPLSAGEIFALFILGITFAACLVLVFAVGVTRGEMVFQPFNSFGQPASAGESAVEIVIDPATEQPVAPNIKDVEPSSPLWSDRQAPVNLNHAPSARPNLEENAVSSASAASSTANSAASSATKLVPLHSTATPQPKSTLLQLVKEQPDFMLS